MAFTTEMAFTKLGLRLRSVPHLKRAGSRGCAACGVNGIWGLRHGIVEQEVLELLPAWYGRGCSAATH